MKINSARHLWGYEDPNMHIGLSYCPYYGYSYPRSDSPLSNGDVFFQIGTKCMGNVVKRVNFATFRIRSRTYSVLYLIFHKNPKLFLYTYTEIVLILGLSGAV